MNATNPHPTVAAEIHEITKLREALEWARNLRIRVAPNAPPVECISHDGPIRWARRDPDSIIDPIGAAILRAQPRAVLLADAAAEALNSTLPACEGIADGLSGEPPAQCWVGSSASRLYYPGFIAGVELRTAMLSWVCSFHKLRMGLGTNCPACERALS